MFLITQEENGSFFPKHDSNGKKLNHNDLIYILNLLNDIDDKNRKRVGVFGKFDIQNISEELKFNKLNYEQNNKLREEFKEQMISKLVSKSN